MYPRGLRPEAVPIFLMKFISALLLARHLQITCQASAEGSERASDPTHARRDPEPENSLNEADVVDAVSVSMMVPGNFGGGGKAPC